MDVHVGSDGWLFLVGGSNDVLSYYTKQGHFDHAAAEWVRLFSSRVSRAKALNARYHHMIVPDKLTVHAAAYCGELPFREEAPSRALPRRLAAHADADVRTLLINVLPLFEQRAQKGAELYWKTDSHWTFQGAFSAYQVYCHAVGAASNNEMLDAPEGTAELLLDLGRKLDPPIRETYVTKRFLKNARRIFANPIVQFKESTGRINEGGLHLGSHVAFVNDAPHTDPRCILVFGDSYSEFRTHQLTGILAETFAETHFIWSPSIDWDYAQSIRPNLILTEMAERFMNVVPVDDLDIQSYAAARLAAFKETM